MPELSQVLEWYEQWNNSLLNYKDYLIALGTKYPGRLPDLYRGMENSEFEEYFEELQGELQLLCMFELITSTEGKIRLDFFERVKNNNQDIISKKYQEKYRKYVPQKAKEIRLESLVELWKTYKGNVIGAKDIGEFKNRMKMRHWIAHGRYWDFNSHKGYTVGNTFDKCNKMIRFIPMTY